MNDGIHANIGAIQNMEATCDRFARTVVDRLPSIERELRQVSEALDDRRDDLRREVSSLHDEILSAAEEDDTSSVRRRLEDAEEDLASLERRSRRLAAAGATVTGQVRKINHLATDHAARTREFLRATADNLKAYLAKTQESLSNAAFPPSRVTTGAAVSGGAAVVCATSMPHAKSIGDIVNFTDRDVDVFKDQQGPLAVEAKTKEYEQRLREYPELAGLTLEEYLAINRYTQHDYAPINEAFRTDDKTTVGRWGSHIRLASRGLHKLPAYEGVVYRGVESGEFLNNYIPGQTVIEKSFTSASQDLRSILSFGKTCFEIQSKTGRDIKSCSAMQSAWAREKEVLFVPNTRFEVTGRFKRDGATIIQLREL